MRRIRLSKLGVTKRCARAVGWASEVLEPRVLLSAAANQSAQDKAVQFFDTAGAVFVQNQGQWADDSIKYAYNGNGINIGFTDAGPVLDLFRAGDDGVQAADSALDLVDGDPSPIVMEHARIAVSFDGARATSPVGIDRSATQYNFLVGDAGLHRSNVAGFGKINYPNLYAGVDLLTWAQPSGMKYEFHVAPGADWHEIRVRYAGSEGMNIAGDGSLHIATALGDLVEQAPVIYQVVNGKRVTVAGKFVLVDGDTYAFDITGHVDGSRELVIDPDLAWATYLPISLYEPDAVAVDHNGGVYVTGQTFPSVMPTAGAYDTTFNGGIDAFVAKIDPTGSHLIYATYFGGSHPDMGVAIAVDLTGNAYVTGSTDSSGLATAGVFKTAIQGRDAFVAKFDPTGSSLLYATYLGGAGNEDAHAIAVDAQGNAYITGTTPSSGWATDGAYQSEFSAGATSQGFVAKINPTATKLEYATYLGGAKGEAAWGIAVDSAGNAFVTGFASSDGWATPGAYSTQLSGSSDAYVAKLDPSGSNLLFATYVGGSGSDGGFAIALDRFGNAYISGTTGSTNLATIGTFNQTPAGGFLAEISASGSALVYATYLLSGPTAIAVDAVGNAYVTGQTNTAGWATDGAYDTSFNGGNDIFIAKISPQATSLLYASYIGGDKSEVSSGIAVDSAGNAYVAGNSSSTGLATAGAYDTQLTNLGAPFIFKFSALVDLYPGDTNGDGKVDFADLVAVAQHYGSSGRTRAQGDVTGDGVVDFKDLVQIAQNYGAGGAAAAALVAALTPAAAGKSTPPKPAPKPQIPARVALVVPIPPPKPSVFASRKTGPKAVWI